MKRLTLLFIFIASCLYAETEVDVSFLVVDLKYNEKQGVKICEVQRTSVSVFKGYNLFGGTGFLAKQFSEILSPYFTTIWAMTGDSQFRQALKNEGYFSIRNLDELLQHPLFLEKAALPVDDPYRLDHYHGIIYAKKKDVGALRQLKQDYPGIVVMDAAIPRDDKYFWNTLLESNERSARVKPCWKLYEKTYHSSLANTIINDLQCDLFVIKPVNATRGLGVIIVDKDRLDKTLKLILDDPKALKNTSDPSYEHWLYCSSSHFLVEEFIESDPVAFPPESSNLYDSTMRIPMILLYHQKNIQIHFLKGVWKLPKKPLSKKGSLNDRHKSRAKHFCKVSQRVQEAVEKQLSEAFIPVYERLLQRDGLMQATTNEAALRVKAAAMH
ncbi:MAG: hypothetical protein WB791_01550 [Waddliaceae bacterium]